MLIERGSLWEPLSPPLCDCFFASPPILGSTLADLGGKEVYANPLTTYYENLQKANEALQKAGKTPIVIKAADKNLMDDDLVQMVNAGLIPATVTTKLRADLWSQVLDQIQPHPDLVIASGQQLAWVMRKNKSAIQATR
jgi:membrane-bound lytic murein transglycosylase MltF